MEDAFARKKLPYNLDAEKSVIGSMLMDRDDAGRSLRSLKCR